MPRPTKRDAILKTAASLFMRHGFARVSIDQIAAAVPISKPTLYVHFADKRALFLAVIEHSCQRLMRGMRGTIETGDAPEETLFAIGYEFLDMVLSKPAIQMHRMLTAEVGDFPEIAELFYHSGPKQMHQLLADYLRAQHRKGTLNVADAGLSADMFLSMVKGYIHLQRLLGLAKPPSKKQMRTRVRYALDLFMKAHATH
ncbi:MAG: TetR/AcrR family transcriptional regulator [Rickettsiales bacterium]